MYFKQFTTQAVIVVLLMFSASCFAQKYVDSNDPNEVKSLLSKDNDIKGFGGIDVKFGMVNTDRSLLLGGYGGVIINKNYIFGLAGYGLATTNTFLGIPPGQDAEKELNLYGGYGGLLIGGILFPKEMIHINIPILLGAGNMDVSDENYFNNGIDTEFTIDKSAFFVIEPGIQIEANITGNLRLGLGATYRMIQAVDLLHLNDDDLSDYTVALSLRFGRF